MITFLLSTLFVLGFAIVAFTVVVLADSLIFGHDLPTSPKVTAEIKKLISLAPSVNVFYDLGCARGSLALDIKKSFPDMAVVGIDNSPIRILAARLKSKFLGRQVKFICQDIFKTSLKDADFVYTYLWYDLMPLLESKLRQELKPGAMVITNTSHFTNWQPVRKIIMHPEGTGLPDFETLFVYKQDVPK